jgi:hypothetical protein
MVEKAERNAENKQELAARAPGEALVRPGVEGSDTPLET